MEYKTVEGEVGAVNALTALTTFASVTGVGPVKVPADKAKIKEIWLAAGIHNDTAGDNAAIVLRLTGKGIVNAPQDFVVAGSGTGVTSTGTVAAMARVYPVDIDVKPNEDITVEVAATGDDVLIATVGVTLAFGP